LSLIKKPFFVNDVAQRHSECIENDINKTSLKII